MSTRGKNNAGSYIGALYHSSLNPSGSENYSSIVGGTWNETDGYLTVENQTATLYKNTTSVTTSLNLSGVKFSSLKKLVVNYTGDNSFRLRINTKPQSDGNDIDSNYRSSYLARIPDPGYATGSDISLNSESATIFGTNYEDIVIETKNASKSHSKMAYTETAQWRDDELLSVTLIATTAVNITSVVLTYNDGTEDVEKKISYNYADYSSTIDKVIATDENRILATYLVYKGEKSYVGSSILTNLTNGGILANTALPGLTFDETLTNLVKIGKSDNDTLKDEVIALKFDPKMYAGIEDNNSLYYSVAKLSGSYTPAELTNTIAPGTTDADYMTRKYVIGTHVYSIADLKDTTDSTGFHVNTFELRGEKRWFQDIASSPVYTTNDTDVTKQLNTTNFTVADLVDVYSIDEILAGSGTNAYSASDIKDAGLLGDEIKYVCSERTDVLSEIATSTYNTVSGIKLLKTQTTTARGLKNSTLDTSDTDVSKIITLINGTSPATTPYNPTELKAGNFTDSYVCDNTSAGAQFTINELYGSGLSAEYNIKQILDAVSRYESQFQNTKYKRNDWVSYCNDPLITKKLDGLTYDSTNGLIESVLIPAGFNASHMYFAEFTKSTDINAMRMDDKNKSTTTFSATNMINAGYMAKHLTRVDSSTTSTPGKLTTANATLHDNFVDTNEVLYEATEVLTSVPNGIPSDNLLDFNGDNLVFNLQDLKSALMDATDAKPYTNYKIENVILNLDGELTDANKTIIQESKFINGGYTNAEIVSGINTLVTDEGFKFYNLRMNYSFSLDSLLNNTTTYASYTASDVTSAHTSIIAALTTLITKFTVETFTQDAAQAMGFTAVDYNKAKTADSDTATLYGTYTGDLDTLVELITLQKLIDDGYTITQLRTDGVSDSLLGITVITTDSDNVTANEFVVDELTSSFNLAVQSTLHSEITPTLSYDAVVDIEVRLLDFLKVFKFNTDSEDMLNTNSSDIEYYVYNNYWLDDTMPNPMNKEVTESWIYSNTKQMKNDFVRHIAAKKFNTHFAVDLFSNEEELVTALETLGANIVTKVKEDVTADKHDGESSTEGDGKCKLTKTLLKQILAKNPSRVYEQLKKYETDNGGISRTSQISVPLVAGDKILFVSTINAHENDTDNAGNQINRSYLIRCTLV